MFFRRILCTAAVLGYCQLALAEQATSGDTIDLSDPNQVFAHQGDAVLTQTGIDAAFSKIDDEYRLPFIRDGARVDQLVRNLMKTGVVAVDARAAGFDQEPLIRERMLQAANRELAEAWMDKIGENAPEADYETMAYEDYIANPEKYRTEQYIDVSHILISTEARSEEEARGVAQTVREQLLEDPAIFVQLVEEYSDDPGKIRNKGSFKHVRRGQMVEPFEDAAFALQNPGDVSDLVQSEYGFHIIRLDVRYETRLKPFEDVREEAIESIRKKHVANYRATYMNRLLAEPIVLTEGAVEVMLKRYFGEDLENAPRYDADLAMPGTER